MHIPNLFLFGDAEQVASEAMQRRARAVAEVRNGKGASSADVAVANPAQSAGRKDDGGKVRYDLLPPELLDGVAQILTFGAAKYGDRNWEKGMQWSRVFGALMRHLWAWWRGENVDAETGKSHLWHAGCCIAFLIAYEARGVGQDDRPRLRHEA